MNLKRLLILTDFDDLSKKVISFAINIARQLKVSEIVSLNIISPAYTHTTSGDLLATESLQANQFNNQILRKNQELAENEARSFSTDKVNITPEVVFGNSIVGLNAIMEDLEAGLLVCGSRDEHSFWQKIFGSETEKIIRKVDFPTVILKEGTIINEVNVIAVAIDVNEETQDGLKDILDFGALLEARLQLLHVITDEGISSEEAIDKLHHLAKMNKLKNYDINIVNNDSLESGLRSFIRKNNPDMVAVLSQGKSKLKKLIYGSKVEDIMEETDKPVFISKVS